MDFQNSKSSDTVVHVVCYVACQMGNSSHKCRTAMQNKRFHYFRRGCKMQISQMPMLIVK